MVVTYEFVAICTKSTDIVRQLHLSSGETHDPVLCNFINLMKLPNVGQLIINLPVHICKFIGI